MTTLQHDRGEEFASIFRGLDPSERRGFLDIIGTSIRYTDLTLRPGELVGRESIAKDDRDRLIGVRGLTMSECLQDWRAMQLERVST